MSQFITLYYNKSYFTISSLTAPSAKKEIPFASCFVRITADIKEAGIDDIGLCTDEKIQTTLAMVHTYPDGDRDFSFYRTPGADMMLNKTEIPEDILKETEMQISKKL